ncbi:hypothetical protein K438DRAFT_1964978 [Mycena galopus ATCC 62051]|nr:hypothetical protein K438DRAFT_1964978 [Mycena galopus ATCC 62051]
MSLLILVLTMTSILTIIVTGIIFSVVQHEIGGGAHMNITRFGPIRTRDGTIARAGEECGGA